MDATLAADLGTQLTSFKTSAITVLGDNLPVALGLTISVAVLFFGIKAFRAIAHV